MKRPITGFGIDTEGDWFAWLSCGHRQHVRHRPPFIDRPWVTTRAGRDSRMGWPLNCVRCDRLEWPNNLVLQCSTDGLSDTDNLQALLRPYAEAAGAWLSIAVERGSLHCVMDPLALDCRVTSDSPGIVPPQTEPRIMPDGDAVFSLQRWQVPQAPSEVTDERRPDT